MEKKIRIKVQGSTQTLQPEKDFKFTEETLVDDLIHASSYHGYLITIKGHLLRMRDEAWLKKTEEFSIQFGIAKEDDVNYSRTPSDQTCEAVVMEQDKYLKMLKTYMAIKVNLEIIEDLISGYRVKIEIMRTVAASLRQQP